MQNKFLILAAMVFLAGCETTKPPGINTVIQRVEVPIAVPCKAEIPVKPSFNFDKLTVEQDVFDKSKTVLADRKLHIGYEIELLAALNSCIKQ
jgi:hypothetical protein